MATYTQICSQILAELTEGKGKTADIKTINADTLKALRHNLDTATGKTSTIKNSGKWEASAITLAAIRKAVAYDIYSVDGLLERAAVSDPSFDLLVEVLSGGRHTKGHQIIPSQQEKRQRLVAVQVSVVALEAKLWQAVEGKVPSYVTTDLHNFWRRG